MTMKLVAICRGQSAMIGNRRPYRTGIFKHPVTGPVMVDELGLVGDVIANKKHHGGPDQALYLEGAEDLAWWESELGRPLPPGTFGENLVISGLSNRDLAVGDRLAIGDVLLEITSSRVPCSTFAARMDDPQFVKRFRKAGRPGAYVRVLNGGVIEAGMDVVLTPYDGERLSMAELMATFGKPLSEADRKRYLSAPIHMRLREGILSGQD